MCVQGPGDDMRACSRAAQQGGTASGWAAAGFRVAPPSRPGPRPPGARHTLFPLPGEAARWRGAGGGEVVRRVLLQSIRLAASLRDTYPTLLPGTSRQTRPPRRNKIETKLRCFQVRGAVYFGGNRSQGRGEKETAWTPAPAPLTAARAKR